ncbi:TPA: hemolysin III family protein [Vibrio vulnificus]|uniref:PAQR family membrane homeostasis protein TrhA n=1 Tax=Vibrio vulnificus TaxID=672 RepID=UPI001A18DB36|nr:hemolysin III family protein [Vibrio vulnificus]ELY5145289.1 hemolysin III family protein [Vibrio vulnificus]MCA0762843.1 hemolysin III family protein [Vibrio vulnificus]MCA0781110.1 hemolysin III family protein [Vibrio vulnificus]MCU8317128.1 hemolysin III family protein [Vibrio vulnificus]WIL74229.1 hemolysin III family protein [Vibrio vulnificus]
MSVSQYSVREEVANAVTHGLGMIFGIVGLVMLLVKATEHHADGLTIASMAIYGSSIIVLFLASTLYHAIPYPKAKRWLKTFDHSAIYLLIAGSYTPFLLVSLRTPLAIGLMIVIWSIALLGIIMKVAFVYRFKRFSLVSYLLMGWLSLIVIYQLAISIEIGGLTLLAAGGLIYSLGVIFYVAKKIPYNHAIWHCFVLAGCVCHFLAIYLYVNPV